MVLCIWLHILCTKFYVLLGDAAKSRRTASSNIRWISKKKFWNQNCLHSDQVIEQTMSKKQKGPSEIIGFSTSPRAALGSCQSCHGWSNFKVYKKTCFTKKFWWPPDYLLKEAISASARVAYFAADQYLQSSIKFMEKNRR